MGLAEGHNIHMNAAVRGMRCTHAGLKDTHVERPQIVSGYYVVWVQRSGVKWWDGTYVPCKEPTRTETVRHEPKHLGSSFIPARKSKTHLHSAD
jgi:hypothetical protein